MRDAEHSDLTRWLMPRPTVEGYLETCYVGVVVALPALTGAAAFDAGVTSTRRFVPGAGSTPGCLRSRYGTIRDRPLWPGVAAELTLERWDAGSCELGVRPRREVLVDPTRRRVRCYLTAARALLDELAVVMVGWALAAPYEATPSDIVKAALPISLARS